MKFTHPLRLSLLALSAVIANAQIIPIGPPTVIPQKSPKAVPLPAAAAAPNAALAPKGSVPRDMKLLVVAVDGTEPSFAAIKSFIETLGIPYQVAFTVNTSTPSTPSLNPLPALADAAGTKGYFQGIILTSGNLAYCGVSPCISGLNTDDWTRLETYTRDFGVRMVAMYAWPEPRWGLAYSSSLSAGSTPVSAALTGDAATLFPYLNRTNPVPIANSYIYLSTAAPAAGDSTTPFLTVNGLIVGAVNRKADGREYLALTVDNNPYLTHSLELSYGILNWVTKGVFLGARKVYIAPQVDDLFLANDLFVAGNAACTPGGFVNDPTYDPAEACPTRRATGADLDALADWQAKWNANTQFKGFKISHAFNGAGAVGTNGNVLTSDSLVKSLSSLKSKFYWVTHTWDHEDLDCFDPVPNAGSTSCVPATYNQSITELSKNFSLARTLGLPIDSPSIVTPGISGLKNPNFMSAAVAQGIRYAVSDTSKPEYLPEIPNTGIRNPLQPSVLMIPRRPTNIFYNTFTGNTRTAGSLPDEYNYFFGPNGIFRIGGPGGPPFFTTTQTYNDIVQRESDNLLAYMLRYEIYPQMYHQSNIVRFSGARSLLTDVHDAAFQKFSKISNLPVISLQQTEIGQEIERKMNAISAGVSGVLTPGVGITLTAATGNAVPIVTGACGGGCEVYGGQCLSKLNVNAGYATTISLSSASCTAPSSVTTTPIGAAPVTPTAPATSTQTAATLQTQTAALQKSITTLVPTVDLAAAKTSLNDAATALNGALVTSLWTSAGVPASGAIFDNEKNAALKLMDALAKNTDPESELDIQAVADKLVMINVNVVTKMAIAAAAKNPFSPEWLKAFAELAKAAIARDQGKYSDAIGHLKTAWESADKIL